MFGKPFVLSVNAVILDKRARCLVLKRSLTSRTNAGKWDFPGGKLDPNESFQTALEREVLEETGLVISLDNVLGVAESEQSERRIAYIFMRARTEAGKLTLSHEHDDYAWVSVEEVTQLDLCPQFREFAASLRRSV